MMKPYKIMITIQSININNSLNPKSAEAYFDKSDIFFDL